MANSGNVGILTPRWSPESGETFRFGFEADGWCGVSVERERDGGSVPVSINESVFGSEELEVEMSYLDDRGACE